MTRNPVGDNESFSAVYWSAITNANDYEYIRSGCAPSKGTGSWDVDVAAGEIVSGGTNVTFAGGTATLTAADATNPRVDLVTLSATGALTVTTGTPASNPAAPDIPAGNVLIAAVFLPAGAGSLTAGDIHDYRVIGSPSSHPFGGADIAAGVLTQRQQDEFIHTGYGTSGTVATIDVTDAELIIARPFVHYQSDTTTTNQCRTQINITYNDATTRTLEASQQYTGSDGAASVNSYGSSDLQDQAYPESGISQFEFAYNNATCTDCANNITHRWWVMYRD